MLYSLKYRFIHLKFCGLVNRSGERPICEAVNDAGGKLFQVKFVALTKFLVLSIFLREQLKESSLFTKKFNFSRKTKLEHKIR